MFACLFHPSTWPPVKQTCAPLPLLILHNNPDSSPVLHVYQRISVFEFYKALAPDDGIGYMVVA